MGKKLVLVFVISLLASTIVSAATNMKFFGDIEAEWRYTSENGWEGWDRILLSSILETGNNTKAVITFGDKLGQRGEQSTWYRWDNRNFGFYIDRAYLQYKGALYKNAPTSTITLGDLSFKFHPYFLMLNAYDQGEYLEYEYDQCKRGILIEDLQTRDVSSSFFYFQDGTGDNSRFGFGYKGHTFLMGNDLIFYNVSFRDMKLEKLDSSGKVSETFEHPELIEDSFGFEMKRQVSPQLFVDGVWGTNSRKQANFLDNKIVEQNYCTNIYDLGLEYAVDPMTNVTLKYIDIPGSFDPIWRDRTPRYHPRLDKKLGWNMIDKYNDKRGILASFAHQNSGVSLGLNLESLRDCEGYNPRRYDEMRLYSSFQLYGNKLTFWQCNNHIKTFRASDTLNDQYYKSTKFELSRSVFDDFEVSFKNYVRQSQENEVITEISIGKKPKSGLLLGFDYRLGIRDCSPEPGKVFPFFELEGRMPIGFDLTIRYAGFNRIEDAEYRYNEDDELIGLDNIFRLQAKLSF